MWKEAVAGYFKIQGNRLVGLKKSTKRLRMISIPAEIGNWQLPNIRQQLCRLSQLAWHRVF
jgi:hypothetical protein